MNKRKKERDIKETCQTTLTQIYVFFREELYYEGSFQPKPLCDSNSFVRTTKFQPKCRFLAPQVKSEVWIGLFYQNYVNHLKHAIHIHLERHEVSRLSKNLLPLTAEKSWRRHAERGCWELRMRWRIHGTVSPEQVSGRGLHHSHCDKNWVTLTLIPTPLWHG